MPTLLVKTNAALPNDPSATLKIASATVAELLGKPERYVMVLLEPVAHLCFAGSTAPAAYLELKSLGLPENRTPDLSGALCELVEQQFGVAKERVYIEFASPARHLFGYDGRTFG